MNEFMVQEWNKMVRPEDRVLYLGDLILTREPDLVMPLRRRLNGIWDLFIAGNHDDGDWLLDRDLSNQLIRGSHNRKRRQENKIEKEIDGAKLVLSHYPVEIWQTTNRYHSGYWNLHGHTHAAQSYDPKYPRQIHIGVDSWGYKPAEWSEIKALIDKY
jgi:calcineurin-like phosphoesterase family protein